MEVKIKKIIESIEKQNLGKLLRWGERDIDIYSTNYKELSLFLYQSGFTNTFENNYKGKFGIFINQRLIILDIVKNCG